MRKILTIFIGSFLLGTVGSLYAHRGVVVNNPVDAIDPIDDFEKSFENKVLSIQRKTQIDMNVEAPRALFYGTHNSYNSNAYNGSSTVYVNPDQKYSITDQLRLGARYLELEVHWTVGKSGRKELLLCRGDKKHLGCNPSNRPLTKGLIEILSWITALENRNNILLIRIKDNLDGHYDEAFKTIDEYLGPWLYQYSSACSTQITDYASMPKSRDMIMAGRRILLVSDSCREGDPSWSRYFKLNFFLTSSPKDFPGYPDCKYPRSAYDKTMVYLYNTAKTMYSAFNGRKDDVFTDEGIQSMLACEVNVFGINQYNSHFAKQAIWSWDVKNLQPSSGDNKRCAVLWDNGRWHNRNCAEKYRFACKDEKSGTWSVTSGGSSWADGNAQCNSETGGRSKFSAPRSSYENKKLSEAKKSVGAESLWINLTDQMEKGNWVPGDGDKRK
ncbi:hypothetical protein [Leptospira alstonii]|uniref:hypothetical protein n=1 Tax=Leptospira alstonii TaxID=28452 RepID=UPI0007747F60|nr:hypothetical protein [Leptospira alstonii]